MEPAQAGDPAPRAFLHVGGANVARHQLALALAAGCERIICVAREFGPEIVALQHEAERGGAKFHVVPGPRGFTGLVSAADEVLVISEGLLATMGDALRLLGGPPAVFVQPAEAGIPAGFERIDLNHAAAGLMLIPGRLVDRLMELPVDADPASALLRIALQAGIPQRAVPDEVRLGGRWLLVRDEAEAHAAEDGWMVRHTQVGGKTPGQWLARVLVRRFGPALLHGGGGSGMVVIIAVVLAAIGFGSTWFGYGALGFGLTGLSWVIGRTAGLLERIQRESLSLRASDPLRQTLFECGYDALLVAMLAMVLPALPGERLAERCFAPLVLIGLLRLLPRGFPARWSDWAEDRLALTVLMMTFLLGRVIDAGVPALVAMLLVAGLALPHDADRITRA